MDSKIIIYTDGACSGNPGPGGWGVVMLYNGQQEEYCGGDACTTNNRMELQAVIEALLRCAKESSSIMLYTDSQYVHKGMTEWLANWQRRGWKTANGKPVKNLDLWQRLVEAAKNQNITWQWVLGHNGLWGNERADTLARCAIEHIKRSSHATNRS